MLTRKQMKLLTLIDERIRDEGVPPSFDEMKDALNLRSKSGIHRMIKSLEERGFIRRMPNRARALEVVKRPDALGKRLGIVSSTDAESGAGRLQEWPGFRQVDSSGSGDMPVMGRIAAGTPADAIAHEVNRVPVPPNMIGANGNHYALEVRGDSMTGAGINDGDIAVIRESGTAETGDIVVALVDGNEATLKRFHRKSGAIELEAANPAYPVQTYRDDQVQVQGKLVGLIRTY